jgi:hypothetical protein
MASDSANLLVIFGIDDLSTDQLAKPAHQAISDGGEKVDDEVFDRLARRLSYVARGWSGPRVGF